MPREAMQAPQQLRFWTGPGYQISLFDDETIKLEFFGGQAIVSRAEFKAILRVMQLANRFADLEFDHPALNKWALPPD